MENGWKVRTASICFTRESKVHSHKSEFVGDPGLQSRVS